MEPNFSSQRSFDTTLSSLFLVNYLRNLPSLIGILMIHLLKLDYIGQNYIKDLKKVLSITNTFYNFIKVIL